FLEAAPSAEFLRDALAGRHGAPARRSLRERCEQLLAAAVDDLPSLAFSCSLERGADGRVRSLNVEVAGSREWTAFEKMLAATIALNLEREGFGDAFVDLLDLTELRLRESTEVA